jgi:hypothetical protein
MVLPNTENCLYRGVVYAVADEGFEVVLSAVLDVGAELVRRLVRLGPEVLRALWRAAEFSQRRGRLSATAIVAW